jgi:hypothetical protein
VIRVNQVRQEGEHWLVTLQVHEGVYRLPSYPVRVENVPRPPVEMAEETVKICIGEFVVSRVEQHMREGSLPPRGTRLDGRDASFANQRPSGLG